MVEGGQLGVVHVQDHSWMIDPNPLLQTHTMLESRPLVQTQTILEKTPGSATWATVVFIDGAALCRWCSVAYRRHEALNLPFALKFNFADFFSGGI